METELKQFTCFGRFDDNEQGHCDSVEAEHLEDAMTLYQRKIARELYGESEEDWIDTEPDYVHIIAVIAGDLPEEQLLYLAHAS